MPRGKIGSLSELKFRRQFISETLWYFQREVCVEVVANKADLGLFFWCYQASIRGRMRLREAASAANPVRLPFLL